MSRSVSLFAQGMECFSKPWCILWGLKGSGKPWNQVQLGYRESAEAVEPRRPTAECSTSSSINVFPERRQDVVVVVSLPTTTKERRRGHADSNCKGLCRIEQRLILTLRCGCSPYLMNGMGNGGRKISHARSSTSEERSENWFCAFVQQTELDGTVRTRQLECFSGRRRENRGGPGELMALTAVADAADRGDARVSRHSSASGFLAARYVDCVVDGAL